MENLTEINSNSTLGSSIYWVALPVGEAIYQEKIVYFLPSLRHLFQEQAKLRAKKIMNSLHEAEQIHTGKRKGKSFDNFLTEL